MFLKPARKINIDEPNCQPYKIMSVQIANFGSPSQENVGRPIDSNIAFTAPSFPNNCLHIIEIAILPPTIERSEEHTSELQSRGHLVCRLLLERKKSTRPSSSARRRERTRRPRGGRTAGSRARAAERAWARATSTHAPGPGSAGATARARTGAQ